MTIRITSPRMGSDNLAILTGLNAWSIDSFRGVSIAVLGYGIVIEWERPA
jgi:hypothetical protein